MGKNERDKKRGGKKCATHRRPILGASGTERNGTVRQRLLQARRVATPRGKNSRRKRERNDGANDLPREAVGGGSIGRVIGRNPPCSVESAATVAPFFRPVQRLFRSRIKLVSWTTHQRAAQAATMAWMYFFCCVRLCASNFRILFSCTRGCSSPSVPSERSFPVTAN